jgi:hypothetical protein
MNGLKSSDQFTRSTCKHRPSNDGGSLLTIFTVLEPIMSGSRGTQLLMSYSQSVVETTQTALSFLH